MLLQKRRDTWGDVLEGRRPGLTCAAPSPSPSWPSSATRLERVAVARAPSSVLILLLMRLLPFLGHPSVFFARRCCVVVWMADGQGFKQIQAESVAFCVFGVATGNARA
jgi:hypothetical protein